MPLQPRRPWHRRQFLRWSAGSLAAALLAGRPEARQIRAASNRVRLGVIGFGSEGARLARLVPGVQGAEIVAVADLYDGRLARARELAGDTVQTAIDGRRLLDRHDIDAVVIATPDHWHLPLIELAARSGKDVYCAAPVIHRVDEAARLRAALASGSRVLQCGGGWISSAEWTAARELLAQGRLGRVTLVRGLWDTTSALDAWQIPFPPDASPESIDFDMFLGSAPRRTFDPARFFRWRAYREYGSGLAGARLVPQLTAIHWLLDLGEPRHVSAAGALHRWRDGRDVPDTFTLVAEYPAGVTVQLSASLNATPARELRICGTAATLVLGADGLAIEDAPSDEPYTDVAETWAKEYRDWFYMMHGMSAQGQVRGVPSPRRALERFETPLGAGSAAAHLADFVDAVRTRRQPREHVELGLSASVTAARAADLVRLATTEPETSPR